MNIIILFILLFILILIVTLIIKRCMSKKSNKKINTVYIWGIKHDEPNSLPPMKYINMNKKYVNHKIIFRKDIEKAIQQYNNTRLTYIWNKIPKWIIQADLGRYIYIYMNGGFYLDVDCTINKCFEEYVTENNMILFVEKELKSYENLSDLEKKSDELKVRIANYAFGSLRKNNIFLKKVIEECMNRLEKLLKIDTEITAKHVLWVCGPDVITTIYHKYKNTLNIKLLDKSYVKNHDLGSWR